MKRLIKRMACGVLAITVCSIMAFSASAAVSPIYKIKLRGHGDYTGVQNGCLLVEPGCKVGELLANMSDTGFVLADYNVYNAYGYGPKDMNAIVRTGEYIIMPSQLTYKYIICVRGDVNQDGYVEQADIDDVQEAIMSGSYGTTFFYAADVNEDGVLSVSDLIWMKNYVANNTR